MLRTNPLVVAAAVAALAVRASSHQFHASCMARRPRREAMLQNLRRTPTAIFRILWAHGGLPAATACRGSSNGMGSWRATGCSGSSHGMGSWRAGLMSARAVRAGGPPSSPGHPDQTSPDQTSPDPRPLTGTYSYLLTYLQTSPGRPDQPEPPSPGRPTKQALHPIIPPGPACTPKF